MTKINSICLTEHSFGNLYVIYISPCGLKKKRVTFVMTLVVLNSHAKSIKVCILLFNR